jgi:PAS domain S-box-containing protein
MRASRLGVSQIDWLPPRSSRPTIATAPDHIAQQAERTLRRISEAQLLTSLVKSADDAIFAKAIDGTIMSWNAGAERIYGYTSAEMVGTSVSRLAPPDRVDEIVALLARVAAGERIDQYETVRVAKDGRQFRVSLTISPIRDARDHLIGASTVAREILPMHLADIRTSAQRELLEMVPAAVVGVDGHGNVRLWNRGAVELFGWEAADVLGQPIFDDVKPLLREVAVRKEVAVRRRDGSTADVLAAAFPVRDDAGVILEHVAIAIDISQHRRASAALEERELAARARETRFKAFVEQGALPIVTYRDGRIIDANGAFAALFGSDDSDSLTGTAVVDLLTPAAQQAFVDMARDESNGFVVPDDFELTGHRPDGTDFPLLVRRTVIELADGPATLATMRDVSVEKRAEAERVWLLAAVEQSADMIVLTDLGGRIVFANGATLRATGFEHRELAGAPIAKLGPVTPESLESAAEAALALAANHHWAGWATYRRAGGAVFDAAVTIAPVLDSRGLPVANITIGRDITLERSLEAQLRQSQKMDAVGQLAGGIAHDFNNLLTAIRGYGELIRRRLPEEDLEMRADVDEVIFNADRAAALTRQLLTFSRRQVLHPEIVDPAMVVEGVVPLLRRLLGEEVVIETRATPGVGRSLVDVAQLEQVIVNLSLNARDSMAGGGEIWIETDVVELDAEYGRTHPDAVPGRHVMISVTDTGTGMDASIQDHIFEPFFTTKPAGEGTGLGLATVHGIVAQSGGSIQVYSELGHGTSVKVYLPRVEGEPSAMVAAIPTGPPPRGSERVLLVEDERAVRSFASRVLRDLGYEVLETGRADVAVAVVFAETKAIDLLLTDVVLPVQGGRELARELTETRPGLRVLFMSGYPERRLARGGAPTGSFTFLAKPFTADALGRAVRDALDRVPDASLAR